MSVRYMLDTNTVSYFLKGQSAELKQKFRSLDPGDHICLSSVTEAEVLFGLERVPTNSSRHERFSAFLRRVSVLPWGRPEANIYGAMRAQLQAAGTLIGAMDMLIAAHAMAASAVLITSDKAFRHVRGLQSANWATDIAP